MVFMDPLRQFLEWYDQAEKGGQDEPEAAALATASRDGKPSVRMVLYRGTSEGGLRFFTNYESRKGVELAENPHAALLFFWTAPTRRQVRVEGTVERLSAAESDAYFSARPRGHQVSAWVSRQSRPVQGRSELVSRKDELTRQFGEEPVPRPDYWGGYRVVPVRFEFWTAAPDRLHDRIVYARLGDGWRVETLAP
jgi:pyridoxamine 5'-phosphate oxidase